MNESTISISFPDLHDAELTAPGGVLAVLRDASLTPAARQRIADYLKARFDADMVAFNDGKAIPNV